MIKFRPSAKYDTPATIILLDQEQTKKHQFPLLKNKEIVENLKSLHKSGRFNADNGEMFPLVFNKQIILLTGLGGKKDLSPTSIRMVVRKATLSPYLKKIADVQIIPHKQSDTVTQAIIEGFFIGTYSWKKYQTKQKDSESADKKTIHLMATNKKTYADLINICEGVTLARNLVNDNADVVTSTYLEKTIKDLVKGKKNVSLEILGQKELKTKGLNLHLAVNQGSNKEPKLIIVKYHGASQKGDYTALIGKGITFDSGGLNLKPTKHIETMRCDMSGAATVIGTLRNVLSLKVKKNILFVVGIAENAIGSLAYKPGDVIKSYNGMHVEIGNTDAEGRLVLADAISYIAKNYKPARIIDIATLTGACVVALGYDYTGLVATNEKLAQKLLESAEQTDDRAWRLPSYPEIKNYVKSSVADIQNISTTPGAGGTITAAEFLRQFTEDINWAHLDIAGTAFVDKGERLYYAQGATGAGVRLLTNYLLNKK